MPQFLVETRTDDERDSLSFELDLTVQETYPDGSCLVNCSDTHDQNDLVEYCAESGIKCSAK